MNTKIALYFEDKPVHVRGEMTSLTDMWKASGSDRAKRPVNWLASAQAIEFREFLEGTIEVGNSDLNPLVQTERSGTDGQRGGGSTWAHWQLAMAYAKYLSPAFHAWCNSVVRAFMTGQAQTPRAETPELLQQTIASICAAMFKQMREDLRAELDARVEARLLDDPRLAAIHNIGALEVCDEAGIGSRGRGGFLRHIARKLAEFCAERSYVASRAADGKRLLFPREAVAAWRKSGGGDEYLANARARIAAKIRGQVLIQFPKPRRIASPRP